MTTGNDFTDLARQLYHTAEDRCSWDPEDIAAETECSPLEAERAVGHLKRMGLLLPAPLQPSGYQVVRPVNALARLVSMERELTEGWMRDRSHRQEQILSLLREFPPQDGPSETATIDMLPTASAVNEYIEERALDARVREQAMHPGGVPPVELLDEMIHRDLAALDQGVQLEAIYAHHLVAVPHLAEYLTEVSRHGAEIRVAPAVPLRMIVIDDDIAILPIDPTETARGAFAVRSRQVVAALRAIFGFHWAVAAPLTSVHGAEEVGEMLSPFEKMVFHMMAMGSKDEAIARQLGISTRTLSRKVSRLLERLRVQTRFQAAVKLSESGMLDLGDVRDRELAG
ncbi:helix-turn-helix transcriptional regulator [Streptomyces sp. SLBN-118]|uniref:helix-turn-helix transcriptional regulator n=1 Tax=Streptomyces sp. SLBN-118 TaxID=2768454 RepID=UPI00135C4B86|nr:helix-turn-helix transcriptional regulator [Streptomyces sp. SLBN-118]